MASLSGTARKPTPTTGLLEEIDFAELLLGLARDRFTGGIYFRREEVKKRILFQGGLPVLAESNLAGESLANALLEGGHLDAEQHRRIGEAVRGGDTSEGSAVLALECVETAVLFDALRAVTRRRILECFQWQRGQFEQAEELELPSNAAALRCDPVSIALEGVAIHWAPKRVKEALVDVVGRYPHPTPATANLLERLGADPDTRTRCEGLDGTQLLGEGLAGASPVAWSAALVLERLGAWALSDTPWSAEAEDEEREVPKETLPEYDIVIGAAQSPQAGDGGSSGDDATANRAAAKKSGDAEVLLAEIQELHERLEDLDHYEVLGGRRIIKKGPIKRSYFQRAKRFHPDVLARAGLEEAKEMATEVFARIATAHEVLKDPQLRREYDANRNSDANLDASRLIQAESLFRKGEIMLGAGNFAGALEFLKPAVELWPEESEYQSALGWALFRKAPPDLGGARDHLELACQKGPKNAEAHQRLSMVLRTLEDFAGADSAMARAKILDPSL